MGSRSVLAPMACPDGTIEMSLNVLGYAQCHGYKKEYENHLHLRLHLHLHLHLVYIWTFQASDSANSSCFNHSRTRVCDDSGALPRYVNFYGHSSWVNPSRK